MTGDRWGEVERLLHEAMQLPPAERVAFVANIGDAALRVEVSSLLAAEREGDGVTVEAVIGEAARAVSDEPMTGRMLGHFRVVRSIGHGAMGEVYLAQDVKLRRQVALKLLPIAFQSDSERLRRFEREARAAAALNHPNIVTVHEVGEWEGQPFIATEFIEGETLAQRLSQGPLSVAKALQVGAQIAEALAAAHEKGVIHRDLKPANIKITPDGSVKVLDFGLAKLKEALSPSESPEDSPTVTLEPTRPGAILGTAAYMSPEQARGMPVDKRADIWAFGVVLYEMLTGKSAFQRETIADTLAAVMKEEPDLTGLPARPRAVIGRCLNKELRKRWQDISDVRFALDEESPDTVARPASRVPWIVAIVACIVALGAGIALLYRQPQPAPQPSIRFSVDLGPEARLVNDRGMHVIAISPDGMRIAFACEAPGGELRICTRRLNQSQPVALAGTEGVQTIFFSPDGKWVGFSTRGKLKKASVEGGAPVTLCDVGWDRGAAWGEDGFIIASLYVARGLVRVPEEGGTPQPLTELKPGEHSHRWPQILPGGKAVLFTANTKPAEYENASLDVVSLKTGERKTVYRGGYHGRYLPGGHLIYMHEGTLFAARMDMGQLALTTPPVPVLDDVTSRAGDGGADFDFSQSGIFVYQSRPRSATTIQWLQKSGKVEPLLRTPAVHEWLRLSPDGKRVALVIEQGVNSDIWVYDLERGTMSRITFGGGFNLSPAWTPDGKHLAYRSGQGSNLWWASADGSGDAQRLTESRSMQAPTSFSPDGKRLAFQQFSGETGEDIWTVPLEAAGTDHPRPGKPEPFLHTTSDETNPAFSPDGRWLVYASNESGSNQIYVRPFPGPGGKWQISTEGGTSPIWSPNGRELFYTSSDRRIMVTSYTAKGESFVAEKPAPWCDFQIQTIVQSQTPPYASSILDVAPDGRRFALLAPANTEPQKVPTHLNFWFNFFNELSRRTAKGQ